MLGDNNCCCQTDRCINKKDAYIYYIRKFEILPNNNGLNVQAYCIMSPYVELLITSPDCNLSDILSDFTKLTFKTIIEVIESSKVKSQNYPGGTKKSCI